MDNMQKTNLKLVSSYNIATTFENRKMRVIQIKAKAGKLKKIWIGIPKEIFNKNYSFNSNFFFYKRLWYSRCKFK